LTVGGRRSPVGISEQLVADGYEILLAESRRQAIALLPEHHPQLVLADINGHTLGLLDAVSMEGYRSP
jgi:CheY-like chemotaxis protein